MECKIIDIYGNSSPNKHKSYTMLTSPFRYGETLEVECVRVICTSSLPGVSMIEREESYHVNVHIDII